MSQWEAARSNPHPALWALLAPQHSKTPSKLERLRGGGCSGTMSHIACSMSPRVASACSAVSGQPQNCARKLSFWPSPSPSCHLGASSRHHSSLRSWRCGLKEDRGRGVGKRGGEGECNTRSAQNTQGGQPAKRRAQQPKQRKSLKCHRKSIWHTLCEGRQTSPLPLATPLYPPPHFPRTTAPLRASYETRHCRKFSPFEPALLISQTSSGPKAGIMYNTISTGATVPELTLKQIQGRYYPSHSPARGVAAVVYF